MVPQAPAESSDLLNEFQELADRRKPTSIARFLDCFREYELDHLAARRLRILMIMRREQRR